MPPLHNFTAEIEPGSGKMTDELAFKEEAAAEYDRALLHA